MSDSKESTVMFDVDVPMRDDVKLSANVFLPRGPGQFPVLLNRTPYAKDSTNGARLRHKSAFPSFAPNYNTGESIWEETEPIKATQKVFRSDRYPSRLVLKEVWNPPK